MVVVVTVLSGPVSCTSQMFDFIRVLNICFVLSEDVAELEDTWNQKVTNEMKAMSCDWFAAIFPRVMNVNQVPSCGVGKYELVVKELFEGRSDLISLEHCR